MRTVLTVLSRIVLVPLVLAGIAFGLGGSASAAEQATPAYSAPEGEIGAAEARLARIEWQVTDDLALYGYLDHARQTLTLFLERDSVQVWKGTQVGSGEISGDFRVGVIRASIDWERSRLWIAVQYRGEHHHKSWDW